MGSLRKSERAALEAVAGKAAGTLQPAAAAWPDAYLMVKGRRVALTVAAIKGKIADPDAPRVRLRFDKVVLRLLGHLRGALGEAVPSGMAVIVTLAAPIRLPGKTAEAMEEAIRAGLARRPAKIDIKDMIHGNTVRVRLVQGVARGTAKVVGFVHNPDVDPDVLVRLTQSLLAHFGAAAGERAPKAFAGERWLVVASEDGQAQIETYRQICSQLAMPADFKKVFLVLAGGSVAAIAD